MRSERILPRRLFLDEHDMTVPGCAVLDVSMPGLDGLEIQRVLTAASGYHRPVVFVTGKGDIPTSVRAMKAGAIDFLTKPVNDKDLFEAISRAEARDAESRRLHSETGIGASEGQQPDTARTRSVYACCGGTAQQADCRRSGYGRKDHQGPPQPDDGETRHSQRRRSRPHGREAQSVRSREHVPIGPRANSTGGGRDRNSLSWRKLLHRLLSWTMIQPCSRP